MNIEFAPGAAGFREARHLRRIVGYYRESLHASGDIAQLMGTLENVADKHMENSEFRVLRESLPDDRDLARDVRPGFLKRLLGTFLRPSPLEMRLSNQRMEAIDRAERAESVSFDAMAEMNRVLGERDDLQTKVAELEQAVKRLEQKLEGCKQS